MTQKSALHRTGVPPELVGNPSLSALIATTDLSAGANLGLYGVAVPDPGRLVIDPALAGRPGAAILLRYGLELAWLRGVPGLHPSAAILLAARAAGGVLEILPREAAAASMKDPAVPILARLSEAPPHEAGLIGCWRALAETAPGAVGAACPTLDSITQVQSLWGLAAPAESLLIHGGDDRLTLDPETGLNRYLCPPWPQPDLISFGSCTASGISIPGLAAVEAARQALLRDAVSAGEEKALATASARISAALLDHFAVADLADAVLAASGTDATLLLTGLLSAEHPLTPIISVLMSPAETGSGVPEAVSGRHFAPYTASGERVEKGGSVAGFPPGFSFVSVAVREPDGTPRPAAHVAASCEEVVEAAIDAGSGHAVLHAIDGSKTGLAMPTIDVCDRLATRFGTQLDIVIDACQARLEPQAVRRYLLRGWPVLVTGSKFFGAPGFCGAILFPRARLRRVANAGALPDGLGAYASMTRRGVSRRCAGLLLRWSAALLQMRAFNHLQTADIRAAIDQAGAHARAAILRQPGLRLIPAPRPQSEHADSWSDRPSVLTFAVTAPSGDRFLTAAELRPIYIGLARNTEIAGPPCLIGQPVQLGTPNLGGLRIAFSAAQIGEPGDLKAELGQVFSRLAAVLAG
jgi:hypothetical protein